jgi:hypothetical protein
MRCVPVTTPLLVPLKPKTSTRTKFAVVMSVVDARELLTDVESDLEPAGVGKRKERAEAMDRDGTCSHRGTSTRMGRKTKGEGED